MTLIKCRSCEHEISKKAKICPSCGHPNKKASHLSGMQSLGALFFGGATLVVFIGLLDSGSFSSVSNPITTSYLDDIHVQVANDAVDQYRIAKNQGNEIQICVQAGFVSAAYLQAKDAQNYNKWKAVEKTDCTYAGMD